MKTLIKWVGGKRRFLEQIKDLSNFDFDNFSGTYYEPFFGSGALFFDIEPEKAVIGDMNINLIEFYLRVKEKPKLLHKRITTLIDQMPEDINDHYYSVRSEYNQNKFLSRKRQTFINSARFFYLNKVGFNGVYRVNSAGKYNVPVGRHNGHFIPELEQFERASELFNRKNIRIESDDYWNLIKHAQEGDLVYLDPPYYPGDSSKFTGYTDPRFGTEEQELMCWRVQELSRRGVMLIISNSNSDAFFNLLNSEDDVRFNRHIISTKRSINPKAKNKKQRFKETLFINF